MALRLRPVKLTRQESAALKKGIPVQALQQVRKAMAKIARKEETAKRLKEILLMKDMLRSSGGWKQDRDYSAYNSPFEKFFGRSIIDELSAISGKKKRALNIIDDGAGNGHFLSYLKHHLRAGGIRTNTTAVVLTASRELVEYRSRKQIDKIHEGLAERFLPDQKADAIFSIFGSHNYPLLRGGSREILLKYCHSLKKGGFLFLGLDLEWILPRGVAFPNFEEHVLGVLRRHGFEASFYHDVSLTPDRAARLPADYLFVRKIK